MAGNRSIRIAAEPLRTIAFDAISTNFAVIGSALENPAHMYSLVNMTDSDLIWSWDGVTDHGFLGANGGALIFDITTNKHWTEEGLYVQQGLQTYIALNIGATAPTTGSVYLTVLYSAQRSI